jgi:hypothetical protein
MNPAEKHVHDVADNYNSPPHEYVADHGDPVHPKLERVSTVDHQIMVSEKLTQSERQLVETATLATDSREKECFSNALRLFEYDDRFKYSEGYASLSRRPDIVVEHAWAMLDGEKIVDPSTGFEDYYGVVITSEQILQQNTGPNFSPEGIICRRENRDFLRAQGYTK